MRDMYVICLLAALLQCASCAKILLMPFYHYSHVNLFDVAGKSLAQNGHDVTIFIESRYESKIQKSGTKFIKYEIPPGMCFLDILEEFAQAKDVTWSLRYNTITSILPTFGQVCDSILGDQKIMNEIKARKFDLIIIDGVPIVNCFYVIPYKFDIPYMTLSAVIDPWSAGISMIPSMEPLQVTQYNNLMSLSQRLVTLGLYTFIYMVPQLTLANSHFVTKYAPEKDGVTGHEIYRKSAIFLVNQEVTCIDYPRVSAPNYVFIGGSSAKVAKPLPEDVKKFVQQAKHGIVVVSFGSVMAWQNLWTEMKPKMLYALSKIKQHAFILYTGDDVSDFPPNCKPMKWLPQNDLLGQANAKLFITHGGNNGQIEGVFHGVPMLVIPITGDQFYNGAKVQQHSYGRFLKSGFDSTKEEISEAVQDVLSNSTYETKIKKCSAIIRSQPSSQEKIAFWTDHVLKFGGDHLRAPASELSIFQILMVDLMVIILVFFILGLTCCLCCCRCVCRRCCCRSQNKQKKD